MATKVALQAEANAPGSMKVNGDQGGATVLLDAMQQKEIADLESLQHQITNHILAVKAGDRPKRRAFSQSTRKLEAQTAKEVRESPSQASICLLFS